MARLGGGTKPRNSGRGGPISGSVSFGRGTSMMSSRDKMSGGNSRTPNTRAGYGSQGLPGSARVPSGRPGSMSMPSNGSMGGARAGSGKRSSGSLPRGMSAPSKAGTRLGRGR